MSAAEVQAAIRRAAAALADVRLGAAEGVELAAEHVLGESNRHVPIEEGTLLRSGRTSVDVGRLGEPVRAAISYGGGTSVNVAGTGSQSVGAASYAVVQHEDMSLRHDSGRSAKFLENAGNSERRVIPDIVATSIRRRTT